MTQAYNLAILANAVDSSGKLNVGTNASGVLPQANGGTGSTALSSVAVTSVAAGSGISVSASTGAVTISASGGGVTSLNGQTGAITNTNVDAIGSYVVALRAINTVGFSKTSVGSTYAGSGLRYNWNASNNYNDFFAPWFSPNAGGYGGGGSALSGTWRAMGRDAVYNECGNGYWYAGLYVRIS